MHGFLGPNGSGKTTTIRALLGLVGVDRGELRLFGQQVPAALPAVIGGVGALVETPLFFPNFSGRLNLRLLAQTAGVPRSQIEEVLEVVDLTDRADERFKGYSLGMKQRLGIAAALLKEPRLLILDEPSNGLDPAGIRDVRELLATTRGTGAHPPGLWGQLIGSAGRGVLLVVLVGLLGFGVANLLRNTAAAFGFGFGYFAIVENVLRGLRPRWQEWLITDNAVALLQHGGLRLLLNDAVVDSRGGFQTTRQLHLTNLHGALVIGAVTAVVVLVGVVLFSHRDLD